jgi:hypothetical protein
MIVHCAGPRLSNDVTAIHLIPRALGCEPNFLRGPLPRSISRKRGEIAAGNVSCGTGAGVPSIEVTANEAELKSASRMFRRNAVSKSRTGISNFPFGVGYVVKPQRRRSLAPLRRLALSRASKSAGDRSRQSETACFSTIGCNRWTRLQFFFRRPCVGCYGDREPVGLAAMLPIGLRSRRHLGVALGAASLHPTFKFRNKPPDGTWSQVNGLGRQALCLQVIPSRGGDAC